VKKKLVIIGASFLQLPLVQKAKEMDIETHTFAWEDGAVAKEYSDFFYPISITDKEQILLKCIEIKPDGIISIASDLAMPTVSYIANKLGLTGNSIECTEITTNKYLMRQKLAENGLPSPKFEFISNSTEIDFNIWEFPFMVKAIDRSGARGINLVSNHDELVIAIDEALDVSFKDKVLIEDYFEGTQFSVEMFSINGEHHFIAITDEFHTGAPSFVERMNIIPGNLSGSILEKVIQLTKDALTALQVEQGASHTEVRVNNDDIFFIEIGARLGGDFRNKLIKISTGIDIVELVINNALGQLVEVPKPTTTKFACIKWIFNEEDLKQFNHIQQKYPESVHEFVVFTDNFNNKVTNSAERYGYIILSSMDYHLLLLS